ncbi:MAG: hypothetical protein QOI65_408 [Thermoleophilaceae bacterium]|nr:hypothetical protein [Thermoleophilaceae bacterium]
MTALRHAAHSWGSTESERALSLPCDDLIPEAPIVLNRAVDVDAPPPTVFRWLCQLRTAPYSYDLIDNFGRRSPRELTPGLERLEPGQRFMTIFRLASFEQDRSITLVRGSGLAVSYAALEGRLLMRIRSRTRRSLLPYLDLPMARKQLLTLAGLAERTGGRVEDVTADSVARR